MCESFIIMKEMLAHCNQIDCERDLDDIYAELESQIEVNYSQITSQSSLTLFRGDFWNRTRTKSMIG